MYNGSQVQSGEIEMIYQIKLVDIMTVMPGDTIEVEGKLKTVCKSNITTSKFMGRALFGYNYMCGHEKVRKAIIFKAVPGKKSIKMDG